MKLILLVITLSSIACISAENPAPIIEYIESETTQPPPPHPYVFSYTAGRYYGGHADRTHSEVSDGSGTVRGTYSYVDPRQEIRTVDYIADKNGFHPILSHPQEAPQQSEAVRKATENHIRLFSEIADQRAGNGHQANIVSPSDTKAVAYAKQKHLNAYERIAAEHAKLAEERRIEQELKAAENPEYEDGKH